MQLPTQMMWSFTVAAGPSICSRWPRCSSHWQDSRPIERSVQLDGGTYLGYNLGGRQVRPQVDKTAAIAAFPRPKMKKELRRFLGLAGYYRQFTPWFADLTSPVTNLTRKGASDPVQWTEPCQLVFERNKQALCGELLLHAEGWWG